MAFDPAADLAHLFTTDDFGVSIAVGAASTVGIWDQDFAPVDTFDGPVVEGTESALLVRSSEVPSVAHGQTATVGGTDYIVTGIEPDSDGTTRIVVRRY